MHAENPGKLSHHFFPTLVDFQAVYIDVAYPSFSNLNIDPKCGIFLISFILLDSCECGPIRKIFLSVYTDTVKEERLSIITRRIIYPNVHL